MVTAGYECLLVMGGNGSSIMGGNESPIMGGMG